MNDIKQQTLLFFDQKRYMERTNQMYQNDCMAYLKSKGFVFIIFRSSRNYEHSLTIMSDFNSDGISTALDQNENDYDLSFRNEFFADSLVFRLMLTLSDVGKFYKVNWGLKNYSVENEIGFKHVPVKNLPAQIINNFERIESVIQNELGIKKLFEEELVEKVDWLNEISDFKDVQYLPTLEEFLFGSFVMYRELDI